MKQPNVKIIAEIGVNHDGYLNKAKKLLLVAKNVELIMQNFKPSILKNYAHVMQSRQIIKQKVTKMKPNFRC